MVGGLEEGVVTRMMGGCMLPTKNPKTANTRMAEGGRNETGTDCCPDDTMTAR